MKVARIENFPYILPYNHPQYPTPCPYLKHNIYIYVPVYLPSRKKLDIYYDLPVSEYFTHKLKLKNLK